MASKEAVSTLFKLSKDEEIYEDFQCNYIGTINYMGKLYCCENYICFYSNLIGVVRKVRTESLKIKSGRLIFNLACDRDREDSENRVAGKSVHNIYTRLRSKSPNG
jgi:hypothetical protein